MSELAQLLDANRSYAAAFVRVDHSRPSRGLAIVTCMDARIDVFAALGLQLGDAHVIRNAGGRVTDDVLRSLAVSTHVGGVDTVAVMHHTECAVAGTTDDQLRERTGADLAFLTIADHDVVIRKDIETLWTAPYLRSLKTVAGFLYDIGTGKITVLTQSER